MSKTQLVIKIHDIPQNDHERWALKNGTPLPKGHGRLIDAKDVGEYLTLADVPTIIEADGGKEE